MLELGDTSKVDGWRVWCALCGNSFETIFSSEQEAGGKLQTHLSEIHRISGVIIRDGKAVK